jgi:hypothetical protein
VLLLNLFYIDVDNGHCGNVELRFAGISEVELDELRTENVVDALIIPETATQPVLLESACGLAGSFRCETVEVVRLTEAR